MFHICRFAVKKIISGVIKQNCNKLIKMSSACEIVAEKRKSESENLTSEDGPSPKKAKAEEESVDPSIEILVRNSNKIRKPKKVVLLLSYLGKEFFGMQRNANVFTVEEALLKALLDAGVILQGEFDFPKTMKFQRAARTDKGVSAVRQIVSLRIPIAEINNDLPSKVNIYLPADVRLVAVKRVTQSFDAKIACDARTYSYMLPTFAFSADSKSDERYRITADRIEEVNKFLQNYLGTHNFFNFTSGRLPGDPSCKRYILACECGPPFMSHDVEFSVIKVKGQSFMLHQIRKMVGLAIAIMKNLADESILDKIWLNERIDIPKAPGLGLMLEELHYDWYNKKYGSDGMHEALAWEEYNDLVEEFKKVKICSNIALAEREEKSMMQWLETLPHHSYDVRDAGPPTMLPPKEAGKVDNIKDSSDSVDKCVDGVVIKSDADNVKYVDDSSDAVDKCTNSVDIEIESDENVSVNISPNVNNENISLKENQIKCES